MPSGFEWKQRRRVCGGPVAAIALGADGQLLAAAGHDGTATAWDTATLVDSADLALGPAATQWQTAGPEFRAIAIDPLGQWAATGANDGAITLWDLATGTLLHRWRAHGFWVMDLAVSADGRWLASAGADGTVGLWDRRRNWRGRSLAMGDIWYSAVAFEPDGGGLWAGAYDGTITRWDRRGGRRDRAIAVTDAYVLAVAISADGSTLAAGLSDGAIALVDLRASHKPPQRLTGHGGGVYGVIFCPDGQTLISISDDGTGRRWHLPSGQLIGHLTGDTNSLWTAALSRDGRWLAAAGADEYVRLWDLERDQFETVFAGTNRQVTAIAFVESSPVPQAIAPPQRHGLLMAGRDGCLERRSLAPCPLIRQFPADRTADVPRLQAIALHPAGHLIATAGATGHIQVRSLPDGRTIAQLPHDFWILALAFSPDGRAIAAAGADGTLTVWTLPTGEKRYAIAAAPFWLGALAWSPDGRAIATGSPHGTLDLWHPVTGEHLDRFAPPQGGLVPDGITALQFSAAGHTLASGTPCGAIALWNGANGRLKRVLHIHRREIVVLAFNRPGNRLLSASRDRTVRLWDADTGKSLAHLDQPNGDITDMALDPRDRDLWVASSWHGQLDRYALSL